MSIAQVFKTYIEPSVERIPALEVRHLERHQGREFAIVQTVYRNVLTDFDRKLSRHLAATGGEGFPAVSVFARVRDVAGDAERELAPAHYPSAPHALLAIARRALGDRESRELTLHFSDRMRAGAGGIGMTVSRGDIVALDEALSICREFGEPEFIDISGDFEVLVVQPPGGEQTAVMHLSNGSVSMACGSGAGSLPFECPLHGFLNHLSESPGAQSYLAQVRHALVAEKTHAVMEFRAAAEEQIMRFDRALDGRRLDGFRLDSAIALVERLRLGLGSGLKGLSEDARITALDWAASIAAGGARAPAADYHIPRSTVSMAAAAGGG